MHESAFEPPPHPNPHHRRVGSQQAASKVLQIHTGSDERGKTGGFNVAWPQR